MSIYIYIQTYLCIIYVCMHIYINIYVKMLLHMQTCMCTLIFAHAYEYNEIKIHVRDAHRYQCIFYENNIYIHTYTRAYI